MTLVLRWRVPNPSIVTRWRGPDGVLDTIAHNPSTPIATVIGPPGPAGSGSGSSPFIHTQSSASDEWIVNHNLGWTPSITVLSPGGIEVDAEVVHISVNQARVRFNQPYSGSAIVR